MFLVDELDEGESPEEAAVDCRRKERSRDRDTNQTPGIACTEIILTSRLLESIDYLQALTERLQLHLGQQ